MLNPTTRQWQIEQLEKSISILDYLTTIHADELLEKYRDGGDGWTAREVLIHLLHYEGVYAGRLVMTLDEDMPTLDVPDHEAGVKAEIFQQFNARQMFEGWREIRWQVLNLLKDTLANNPDGWTRIGVHPKRGNMTLDDQVMLMVWHDTNHLEQFAHILAEQKTAI